MSIILLCGYKSSGKDTFANHLEEEHGFKHFKISKPLKDALKILFNFTEAHLEGDLKEIVDKDLKTTPREVMKFVGTNMFQYKIQELLPNIGRNFWVNKLVKELESSKEKNIVISDLRFIHEYETLHCYGMKHNIQVKVVKIIRPSLLVYNADNKDFSETEHLKFKFDCVVENNSIEEFKQTINNILLI